MATGDIRIDALLELVQASLALQHKPGTGAVVTYSFLSSPSVSYEVYGFQAFSQDQRIAIRSMLDEVSSQIGVSFREIDQGGILQYGMYSGRAGIPSSVVSKAESKTDASGSVVWLNSKFTEFQNLHSGQGRQMALHETAHALGLKHPGQYSEFDTGPYLPAELSTATHTIMAYNGGNTEHLGDYDVLALQHLYGLPGNPVSSEVQVLSTYTTASYFSDTIKLDVDKFSSPARVDGLAGTDTLVINIASDKATLKSGLKEFTYIKPDGGMSGIALDHVERVRFTDKTVALDIDGSAGQAYRLYKAAFDRTPDKPGLGYWLNQMDNGSTLKAVAEGFVSSNEFVALNGVNPTSTQLATSLYQHVLGRTPDQTGLAYWVDQLDSNLMNRSDVLIGFSESTENQIAVSGQIQGGIEYTPIG